MIKPAPLFKGCTRPATFMGVPLAPLMCLVGPTAWAMTAISPFSVIPALVIFLVMRALTKEDDQIFRLMGLWLRFMNPIRNLNGVTHGHAVFSPVRYRKFKG